MKSELEIFNSVVEAIHIATRYDSEKITEDSWLVRDIGAESIDLLDISYEIEQRTNKEIDFQSIFKSVQGSSLIQQRDIRVKDIVSYLSDKDQ